MKKKQTLHSSTERLPATTPSLSASSKMTMNHPLNATVKVSAFQTKETPLIKLNKVNGGGKQPNSNSHQTSGAAGHTSSSQVENSKASAVVHEEQESVVGQGADGANKEPVAEVFKQRLVSHRRQLSKSMVFSDQLEIRDP